MEKLQTGVATNLDFIRAMKEKGQTVDAKFPAETLAKQLTEVGDNNITMVTPYEEVLENVNSESSEPEEPEGPVEVNDESSLKEAISGGAKSITLVENIEVPTGNLELGQVTEFNGNGKTITFNSTGQNLVSTNPCTIENVVVSNTSGSTEEWNSTYGIQCYNGDYIVRNCTVSGCNGGILVNSSTVTLEGTIDVSDNKFGGIEVSKSSALERYSVLNVNGASLVNTTEEYGKPTIWTDGEGNTVNGAEGLYQNDSVKENQVQYYLDESNSVQE